MRQLLHVAGVADLFDLKGTSMQRPDGADYKKEFHRINSPGNKNAITAVPVCEIQNCSRDYKYPMKESIFFCQRHKLTVLGKHTGKVVHAQQILLHGAGVCRIADQITGKERLGRGDPFAVYLDLGLILGIKELLHGALWHHVLDALAHYVFATVNDLDHIPHEHHPLAVLRVAHGVWVWLRQGACARRRSIFKP